MLNFLTAACSSAFLLGEDSPSPMPSLRAGRYRLGAGGVLGLRVIQAGDELTVVCGKGPDLCTIRVLSDKDDILGSTATVILQSLGVKREAELELRGLAQFNPGPFAHVFEPAKAEVLEILAPSQTASRPAAETGAASSEETPPPAKQTPAEGPTEPPVARNEPDNGFRAYRIAREGKPDLAFQGKLLASVQSTYWGGRAWLLAVYETPGGKYVAVKTGLSLLPGEVSTQHAFVADSLAAVPAELGYSRLAKSLYADLGLDPVESVG